MNADLDTKAKALARMMAGESPAKIARELGIDRATAGRWLKNGPKIHSQIQEVHDYGQKLGQYLDELLETGIVQQRFFRNESWLREQPAGELAILHGVIIDKGLRLFEAAARANGANSKSELPRMVQNDGSRILVNP